VTATPDRRALAAVFCGGALGGLARTLLADHLASPPATWPWVTFSVNVAGAFALGIVMARFPQAPHRRAFLGTGVCGGLTTFATLQLELVRMLDARAYGLAAGYATAGMAAGLVAVELATRLARPRPVTA
jgi:fluoride exporter